MPGYLFSLDCRQLQRHGYIQAFQLISAKFFSFLSIARVGFWGRGGWRRLSISWPAKRAIKLLSCQPAHTSCQLTLSFWKQGGGGRSIWRFAHTRINMYTNTMHNIYTFRQIQHTTKHNLIECFQREK